MKPDLAGAEVGQPNRVSTSRYSFSKPGPSSTGLQAASVVAGTTEGEPTVVEGVRVPGEVEGPAGEVAVTTGVPVTGAVVILGVFVAVGGTVAVAGLVLGGAVLEGGTDGVTPAVAETGTVGEGEVAPVVVTGIVGEVATVFVTGAVVAVGFVVVGSS